MSPWQHDWTEAEDNTLKKMWRAKLSFEEIAEHFDTSEKEVEARIDALRLANGL
jgi:predicted DNA-binding protein YlxM (UPF0122 family)